MKNLTLKALLASRYYISLRDRSQKRMATLQANQLFMSRVEALRSKYKVPESGLKDRELPQPYRGFERDVSKLRRDFNLSDRWHLPVSLLIVHGGTDPGHPVCGLRFYEGTTPEGKELFVQIFGDTTEAEFRDAWKAIEELKEGLDLKDAEQFRYKNHKLDEIIEALYKKHKSPKTVAEKLYDHFKGLKLDALADQCAGEEFIRTRLARIKKRKDKAPGVKVINSLKDLERINK